MAFQARSVQCPEHGPQQETFVCQHIVQGLKKNLAQGFWIAEDPENLRPDAWCTCCNDALHKAGGEWNDETEAIANVKLLCGVCYDKVKSMNSAPKKWWQI